MKTKNCLNTFKVTYSSGTRATRAIRDSSFQALAQHVAPTGVSSQFTKTGSSTTNERLRKKVDRHEVTIMGKHAAKNKVKH